MIKQTYHSINVYLKRVLILLFPLLMLLLSCNPPQKSNFDRFVPAIDITAGYQHAFIIDANGTLYASGNNEYGQLGTGDTLSRNEWTRVFEGVQSVDAGFRHSILLTITGDVYTTGENANGQLGDTTTVNRRIWTKVATQSISICASSTASMIRKSDHSVWVTGTHESIQGNTTVSTWQKTADYAKQAILGNEHALIITESDQLQGKGCGQYGEMGTISATCIENWETLFSGQAVAKVIAKYYGTIVITAQNKAYVSGLNNYGQLGTTTSTPVWEEVNSSYGSIESAATGAFTGFLINTDNQLFGTGFGSFGELGFDTNIEPQWILSNSTIKKVAGGSNFTISINESGQVWVTGRNEYGQLGLRDNVTRYGWERSF